MNLKSIIYVKDEPDIRHIVKLHLTKNGIVVHDFNSGLRALECAPDPPPDLMLLDVMMRDIDGQATLSKLREIEAYENVPCIFFTAKADASTLEMLNSFPNTAVIYKPFKMKSFFADLQQHYQALSSNN